MLFSSVKIMILYWSENIFKYLFLCLYLKSLSLSPIAVTFYRHQTVDSVECLGRGFGALQVPFWGVVSLCGWVVCTLYLSSGGSGSRWHSQQCVWEHAPLPPMLVLCQMSALLVRSLASCPAEQGTKSLRLESKIYCCDSLIWVLFSVISFLGAFLGGCVEFNRFSLTVLKFYKPWLAKPLILAGNDIAAEETVMVKEVICPGLQCQTCVYLDSANHLPQWGWPSREGICALATKLLSQQQGWDLCWVYPKWYTLLQVHFASRWVSLMWPPLFCLMCLLNQKRQDDWGSSCDTKRLVSELVRKILYPYFYRYIILQLFSRDWSKYFLRINSCLDVAFQMKPRMSYLTILAFFPIGKMQFLSGINCTCTKITGLVLTCIYGRCLD